MGGTYAVDSIQGQTSLQRFGSIEQAVGKVFTTGVEAAQHGDEFQVLK